jgi:hypothetical protein
VHRGSTRVLIMTLLLVSVLMAIILCCPMLRRVVFAAVQLIGAAILVGALLIAVTAARAEGESKTAAMLTLYHKECAPLPPQAKTIAEAAIRIAGDQAVLVEMLVLEARRTKLGNEVFCSMIRNGLPVLREGK